MPSARLAEPRVVAMPGTSPLVTFRIVFRTGAASDSPEKPGTAALTALMLASGGTRELTYKHVLDRFFPMASSVRSQVDKEMTTFSGTTHVDNLNAYYALFRQMLLEPGWRPDDFTRLKEDNVNYLRVGLRGNNDEELGKEVLYNEIYAGHPYGHHNFGTVSSLQRITIDDLKDFYSANYRQDNMVIAIAGGYPAGFVDRVKQDFESMPKATVQPPTIAEAKPIERTRMVIVDKQTRSVAYSIGFPLDVRRGDTDYPALLMAQSYLGQHRMSGGRMYQRLRQLRGLNYGDYAYIEYFPAGMFLMEPEPNLARQRQIFQLWIRPVEPATAHFALRLAMFELDKFVREGLSEEDFERTRNFLSKFVNILTKTKSAELGYAVDSLYYGVADFNSYVKASLAKLTRRHVNEAIRRHLRSDRLVIVAVSDNAQALKESIASDAASAMTYNSPKPDDILKEDKIVERWNLHLKPEQITIRPVDTIFE